MKNFNEMSMKPMIVLPPDEMTDADIKMLRDNGLCVVIAKNPAAVKFIDPIPSAVGRTKIEEAAIQLSRKLLRPGTYDATTRATFAGMFVEFLVHGTPLDPNPTEEETAKKIFDEAKAAELRRLAAEEAKAERLAAKAAKKP